MPPRILLVEDDDTLRFLVADALSMMNASVIECSTADAALLALEALEKNTAVDLVLTDIRMPGELDGFELAQIVWARWPHIPVILSSGNRRVPVDQLPANAAFMAKPWSLDQLFEVVAQRLEGASQPEVILINVDTGISPLDETQS